MNGPLGPRSALSVEPRSKGLGYVASDGDGALVDWGGCRAQAPRHKVYRSRTLKLMRGFGPDILLIEDCGAPSCRRRAKTKRLINLIASDAEREGILVIKIKRSDVLKRFCRYGGRSTFDLAEAVCAVHPVLGSRLPKPRKPWESEHYSTALFEASARLSTFYAQLTENGEYGSDW